MRFSSLESIYAKLFFQRRHKTLFLPDGLPLESRQQDIPPHAVNNMTVQQDFQIPLELSPRPLRFSAENADPVAIATEELLRMAGETDARLDALLAVLARTRFYLGQIRAEALQNDVESLCEALETLSAQLEQTLSEHQVRFEDRTGQPWLPAWKHEIELRGHQVNAALPHAVVAHMEQPCVFRGSDLIARGVAILEGPAHNN